VELHSSKKGAAPLVMKAMVLHKLVHLDVERYPLEPREIPAPDPKAGEVLVKVSVCAVCHTEIDEIEGRTPPPVLPVVPGHQAVGIVSKTGAGAKRFREGDRVGVAWIHSACGACRFCRTSRENLCPEFRATGRDANGGYAEFMTVPERYAHPIPRVFTDTEAAPLLCAGAIGYRSLELTGIADGERLGLTGFGASAHLVLKLARYRFPSSEVYVFARSETERTFARSLGAVWAGDTREEPPAKLQRIIDTTPAWRPVVEALRHLDAGGRLVINAIRKEDSDQEALLDLEYARHLWMEKGIKSVANVTGRDVSEFLKVAAEIPIKPEVREYRLEEANDAISDLKKGNVRGAKVLLVSR
jgi:propanol-preferring alcohol dehydrogenase